MLNLRSKFPALSQKIRGKPLVYLDSAATTLKPLPVIQSVNEFLSLGTANVHRGAHYLSDLATERFESTRKKVSAFIGANSAEEVVFTSGTTDGLNLLATTLGGAILQKGDVVLLTEMEHHANLVPWHLLKQKLGIQLEFIRMKDDGHLDF